MAGKAQGDEPGGAEGDKPGGGEGDKPGEGTGSGQRDRSGQRVIGTDWGVGTTNEAAAEFQIGKQGQQADRRSTETSDWREAYQDLYESSRLDAAKQAARALTGDPEVDVLLAPYVRPSPLGAA